MVWREMRPAPLTDDQITAIYQGREMVAEFELPPTKLFCWHFAVKDDRDYWIVAITHNGKVATRMVTTPAEADTMMRRMISFITLAVLNDTTFTIEILQAQLSMDNDDE